jgi:hypothetical protein
MYDEEAVPSVLPVGGPAYQEILSAIEDREVGQVAIFGYSHGGGATRDLAQSLVDNSSNLVNAFTLPFMAYIDAVENTDVNPGPEAIRPPRTLFHANYYQTRGPNPFFCSNSGDLFSGTSIVPAAQFECHVTSDECEASPPGWGASLCHTMIDDHATVRFGVMTQLIAHVPR